MANSKYLKGIKAMKEKNENGNYYLGVGIRAMQHTYLYVCFQPVGFMQ